MDFNVHPKIENIRKIEDIIDIQKANGNFSVRQVAFNLPSEIDSTVSANLAKSLESGIPNNSSKIVRKKKKIKSKRYIRPLPDVISWPSDSDITVLRMKICLDSNDLTEKVATIPGDGLHQPDSSSMINLATLMRQSQPASKYSLNAEEYLLPLTSWELQNQEHIDPKIEDKVSDAESTGFNKKFQIYEAVCSKQNEEEMDLKDSDAFSNSDRKSRVARFLRLYFCPCCTCLYKIEKMKDDPTTYFTKHIELKS